jgi:serine/threonine protein kinase
LDHPNIVQLYRVFIEEGNIYLMLELCHSANLYTQLKTHGRFSEDKVKNIIRQVCHAV